MSVQAAIGFGFAFFVAPAAFAAFEPEPAVTLVLLLGIAINCLVLFGERRSAEVESRQIGLLLIAAAPGTLAGLWLLTHADRDAAADRGRPDRARRRRDPGVRRITAAGRRRSARRRHGDRGRGRVRGGRADDIGERQRPGARSRFHQARAPRGAASRLTRRRPARPLRGRRPWSSSPGSAPGVPSRRHGCCSAASLRC